MNEWDPSASRTPPPRGESRREELVPELGDTPFMQALRRHRTLREDEGEPAPSDSGVAGVPRRTVPPYQARLHERVEENRQRRRRPSVVGRSVAGLALLLVGGLLGGLVVSAWDEELPVGELRLAVARLVMPADVRPLLDNAVVGTVAPAAAPPAAEQAAASLADLGEQAEAVEARLLAMLETSNLAMQQLAELDELRDAQIRRMEQTRLPAWTTVGGAEGATAEARILEMLIATGALDATLETVKDPASVVTATAVADEPATSERSILAMVGGERGLLGTLDTLDQLRARVAGSLAEIDPAAVELRNLGALERALRGLLVYVDQVEGELAAPSPAVAAVPMPTFADAGAIEGDDPLVEEARALLDRAAALHAQANAFARP
jgi:hypothetical protein